ncbi:MAG TPA: VWA domain-containing protein [Pyrinomonadaceae bacterium]|nr:VWA domain-containing protein [Pyrinomonadaceae bacterium]
MRRTTNLSIFILMLAFALSAFAQTPKPTATPAEDDGEIIRVESRLVVVPVSVTDAAGQPVLKLTARDFRILEENKQQEIAQISDAEKVPLEIALLIDISSSLNPLFKFQQETAAKFLQEVMRPDDRASVFLIGEKPFLAQGRDTAQKTASTVGNLSVPRRSATAFYDGVTAAANYLKQNAPPKSRRVILVLSDGEDNFSIAVRTAEIRNYRDIDVNKLTEKELNKIAARTDQAHKGAQANVLKQLQDADTVFYAVNPAGTSIKYNKISTRAQNAMQNFSDQTGGTAFLPGFQSTALKNTLQNSYNTKFNQETLTGIFRRLASELQAQYLVQYYSEGAFPINKYVKLDVGLQNQQRFKVRARQGYFVKN